MNETAWEAIKRDEDRKIPTAPIGLPVQWYIAGDVRQIVAAIVVAVEGPGRLRLKVNGVNSMPQEKAACYHVNHAIHEQANNPTTYRSGSWDFIPGQPIPKEYYIPYEQDIERRKANLLLAEESAKKAEADFKAKQKDLASGKKKPAILAG